VNTRGRSLELFFIDGRPDGMLTAEVFNWTGHVLRAPRTQLKEALERREARYTGAYLLLGEEDGRARVYIGEAEDMRERLRNHAINKDWWDSAVLITSVADSLNKAHVKYLESRLVEIARDVGAAELENGNTPTRSSLNPAATEAMESFIETLMMVLPAIRIDAFQDKRRPEPHPDPIAMTCPEPVFEFRVPSHNIVAKAVWRNKQLVVLAGSQARAEWSAAKRDKTTYYGLYEELFSSGYIRRIGNEAAFVKDCVFTSPSPAAAVIAARSSNNARRSWVHVSTGQTYAEWEAARIEKDTE